MTDLRDSVTYTLPWPTGATVNHLYRRGRGGQLVLTDAAYSWREHVILIVRQQGQALPAGRVAVRIDYWPPGDRRQHDPDNLLKLTIDTLFLADGETDNRVWHASSTRHDPDGCPRLVARVERFRNEGER